MNFDEQIKLVGAAAGDPKRLALVVLDLSLQHQPLGLSRALEAAAIPRWFDAPILTAVLDDDLKPEVSAWLERVVQLACVERFDARGGWNVHETTRLALRERLQAQDPERLRALSARAMTAFATGTIPDRIERAYHQLLAEPHRCYESLRALGFDVAATPEDGSALAQALADYPEHPGWPPLTRALALLVRAERLSPYRTIGQSLGDYRRACDLLRGLDQPAVLAWAEAALGAILPERGRAADCEEAEALLLHAIDLRETVAAGQTADARAVLDLADSHFRLGDLYFNHGKPGAWRQADTAYRRSLELAEGLVAGAFKSGAAVDRLAAGLECLGDLLMDRARSGDWAEAARHYRRALAIREQVRQETPGSARAARGVIMANLQLATFLMTRGGSGDHDEALARLENAVKIADDLLLANPMSAEAARDVSVSLNRLGDCIAARGLPGDAERALAASERGLAIREQLLAANPDSALAIRDVSVSLNKLGNFLAARGLPGDAARALAAFERSLAISEQLLAANPDSAQAIRDVSLSLDRLGDFLAARGLPGDAERALAAVERGLAISEQLLAANPDSAQAAREVSVSLDRLGDCLAARGLPGDAERALAAVERSLSICEQLLAANPDSARAARDLVVSHYKLAALGMQTGDQALTERGLGACYEVLQRYVGAGVTFDPPIMQLYEQLRPASGG